MTNPTPSDPECGRCPDCGLYSCVCFDDGYDPCWNCGGEGYVADCFEEYACIDPESGCDECLRRCSVCNPRKRDKALNKDRP